MESLGLTPLEYVLKATGGWPILNSLEDANDTDSIDVLSNHALAYLSKIGLKLIIDVSVVQDAKEASHYILQVGMAFVRNVLLSSGT